MAVNVLIFKITSYSLRLFHDVCVLVIFTVCVWLSPMYSLPGIWLLQLLCALAVVMFDSMLCVLLWVTFIHYAVAVHYTYFDNWSVCQGVILLFGFVHLYASCRLIFTHVKIMISATSVLAEWSFKWPTFMCECMCKSKHGNSFYKTREQGNWLHFKALFYSLQNAIYVILLLFYIQIIHFS